MCDRVHLLPMQAGIAAKSKLLKDMAANFESSCDRFRSSYHLSIVDDKEQEINAKQAALEQQIQQVAAQLQMRKETAAAKQTHLQDIQQKIEAARKELQGKP